MPWFPDFVNAAELARRADGSVGRADPVGRYLTALNDGDAHGLEKLWPGNVVVHDPRAGEIRSHRQLRRLVRQTRSWLADHDAHIETVAATCVGARAVVELLAHLDGDGRASAWPVAVVAESLGETSIVFRTYCSQVPIDGRHHLRPPILPPGDFRLGDVVGRYQDAMQAGDAEEAVSTFASDGYVREPVDARDTHRGADELRSYFTRCFSAGGGISAQLCEVTDDGVRCAVEYNCLRWGGRELPVQAGVAVYERGPDGLLAAARVYDDIEAPVA